MKRAALLILVLGAPLVLLLFPRLRQALVRNARLVLLLWAGAILAVGFATGAWSARAESLGAREAVFTLIGIVLVVAAFFAVLRDALK